MIFEQKQDGSAGENRAGEKHVTREKTAGAKAQGQGQGWSAHNSGGQRILEVTGGALG